MSKASIIAGITVTVCEGRGVNVRQEKANLETNPEPINGNTGQSLNADDDGGFFRQKAREYYDAGPMPLPP